MKVIWNPQHIGKGHGQVDIGTGHKGQLETMDH